MFQNQSFFWNILPFLAINVDIFTETVKMFKISAMPVPKEFLVKEKIRGIVKITNLKTEELFLLKSEDCVKSYKDERFKLDLGMHESKNLQEAYTSLGLELFLIEIDVKADKDDNLTDLFEKRKAYYLDNGNRLYNA